VQKVSFGGGEETLRTLGQS